MMILSKVTKLPYLLLHFEQIFEYGGGTGDTSVMCRQLGFTGRHFIYDLHPSLLVQQHFLRSHGWTTYFHDHLFLQDTEAVGKHSDNFLGRKTILLPSDLSRQALTAVISRDSRVLKKSLFMATFSLTESPLTDREKVLAAVDGFAVLLIRFTSVYDAIDNLQYITDLKDQLQTQYHTCLFGQAIAVAEGISDSFTLDHYTFVAMRRDTAPRGLFCDSSHPDFITMSTRDG